MKSTLTSFRDSIPRLEDKEGAEFLRVDEDACVKGRKLLESSKALIHQLIDQVSICKLNVG